MEISALHFQNLTVFLLCRYKHLQHMQRAFWVGGGGHLKVNLKTTVSSFQWQMLTFYVYFVRMRD